MLLTDIPRAAWVISAVNRGFGMLTFDYAAFSGITTDIRLGRRGAQTLRVGFDLSIDTHSFFYSREECPAFVPDCYEPHLSTSAAASGSTVQTTNLQVIQQYTDELYIGEDGYIETFRFNLVVKSRPSSLKNREVAGVLGGAIFENTEISLKENMEAGTLNIFVRDLSRSNPFQPDSGVVSIASSHITRWEFPSEITMHSVDNESSPDVLFRGVVSFVPGFQDVAISRSRIGEFQSILRKHGVVGDVINGRAFIECIFGSISNSAFSLSLQLTPTELINLSTGQLSLSPRENIRTELIQSHNGVQLVCPTRLLFDSDIPENRVLIGRVLTRSVDAVYLDYGNRNIRFGLV